MTFDCQVCGTNVEASKDKHIMYQTHCPDCYANTWAVIIQAMGTKASA
jgi:hypothetical protein